MLFSIQQTSDGGYIAGGWSSSGPGGNKLTTLWGGSDYWIIKIDSLGNKQCEKDLGGTSTEIFSTVIQSSDGGYVLGGYSNSGVS